LCTHFSLLFELINNLIQKSNPPYGVLNRKTLKRKHRNYGKISSVLSIHRLILNNLW